MVPQSAFGFKRLGPDAAGCPRKAGKTSDKSPAPNMHSAPPDLRRTGPIALGRYWLAERSRSGSGRAIGLFHDGVAHAGLVTARFGDFFPAVFGVLAGLERTFDLGGAFH